MWSMSMTVWRLTARVLGTVRWRQSENDPCSSCSLFYISTYSLPASSWPKSSIAFFFFFFSSTCSDMCWWIHIYCCTNTVVCHADACFVGIDHLKTAKAKTVYASRLTAAYIQRSTLHRKVPDKVKPWLSLRWNFDCAGFFSYILIFDGWYANKESLDSKAKSSFFGDSNLLLLRHRKNTLLL